MMSGLEPQARFIAQTSDFTEIDLKLTRSYLIQRLKSEIARVHRHEAQSFHPSVYFGTPGNHRKDVAEISPIDRFLGIVLT